MINEKLYNLISESNIGAIKLDKRYKFYLKDNETTVDEYGNIIDSGYKYSKIVLLRKYDNNKINISYKNFYKNIDDDEWYHMTISIDDIKNINFI